MIAIKKVVDEHYATSYSVVKRGVTHPMHFGFVVCFLRVPVNHIFVHLGLVVQILAAPRLAIPCYLPANFISLYATCWPWVAYQSIKHWTAEWESSLPKVKLSAVKLIQSTIS